MAFDMGFNFRSTAGYVTDQDYAVPVLGETYPHTYTNDNGYSINAGFSAAPDGSADLTSGNDPRLAGVAFNENNGTLATFTVALGSGSAPGAGDYLVDFALGQSTGGGPQQGKLFDDTTLLIDTTSTAGTSPGEFIDATLATVAATTNWTGTQSAETFATTTVNLSISYSDTGYTQIAHFRLILQGGTDARREHIAFGIGRGILIGR